MKKIILNVLILFSVYLTNAQTHFGGTLNGTVNGKQINSSFDASINSNTGEVHCKINPIGEEVLSIIINIFSVTYKCSFLAPAFNGSMNLSQVTSGSYERTISLTFPDGKKYSIKTSNLDVNTQKSTNIVSGNFPINIQGWRPGPLEFKIVKVNNNTIQYSGIQMLMIDNKAVAVNIVSTYTFKNPFKDLPIGQKFIMDNITFGDNSFTGTYYFTK